MTDTGTPSLPAPEIEPFDYPEYVPLSMQNDIVGQKFTTAWNAERFIERYCCTVRYCNPRDMYYIWNGLLWKPDNYGEIKRLCKEQIEDMIGDPTARAQIDLLKHLVDSLSAAGIRNMMFFLEANRLTVREEEIDADKDLINVLNGVINLRTIQYEAPDKSRFITRCMNVKYNPGADWPQWRDHLSLIFNEDEETMLSFQMIAGYALLRENPEQLFFILFGKGENGKSVSLNVLSRIFGEYAMNADYRTFMHRRSDDTSPRSDIARLYGAHLVTSIEGSEGGRLNEALLKAITGHDPIVSRELYQKEQQKYLDAKVFFATNHEPVIRDSSHGMLRRIIKIPFNVQIPQEKRDDQIEEKLIGENSGIFNWLLDGLRAWKDNGRKIKLSKLITDATQKFRTAIDESNGFFTDDVLITDLDTDRISKKDLFQYYQQWYSDKHGEYPSIKQREFNKICEAHGITRDQRVGAGWLWIGIKHLTPLEREERRKALAEEQKQKVLEEDIKKIGLSVLQGKDENEIMGILDQVSERVYDNERDPINYPYTRTYERNMDKVHCDTFVHKHAEREDDQVSERVNEAPIFSCSSACGDAERSKCRSNPSECGRGIPS